MDHWPGWVRLMKKKPEVENLSVPLIHIAHAASLIEHNILFGYQIVYCFHM